MLLVPVGLVETDQLVLRRRPRRPRELALSRGVPSSTPTLLVVIAQDCFLQMERKRAEQGEDRTGELGSVDLDTRRAHAQDDDGPRAAQDEALARSRKALTAAKK